MSLLGFKVGLHPNKMGHSLRCGGWAMPGIRQWIFRPRSGSSGSWYCLLIVVVVGAAACRSAAITKAQGRKVRMTTAAAGVNSNQSVNRARKLGRKAEQPSEAESAPQRIDRRKAPPLRRPGGESLNLGMPINDYGVYFALETRGRTGDGEDPDEPAPERC